MGSTTWMMELDCEIHKLMNQPEKLVQLIHILRCKTWAIELLLTKEALKQELQADPRYQLLLQEQNKHE